MKNNILFLVLTAFIATGCTTSGSSVGDMAIGSDSAAIKAVVTAKKRNFHAPSWNNTVANVLTYPKNWLWSVKTCQQTRSINGAMGTAAGAVGLIGGIAATAGMIKSIF